jgi:hypothetical protein
MAGREIKKAAAFSCSRRSNKSRQCRFAGIPNHEVQGGRS